MDCIKQLIDITKQDKDSGLKEKERIDFSMERGKKSPGNPSICHSPSEF